MDKIIDTGIPLVKKMASVRCKRLPPNIEMGDMIGAGSVGLMEAALRYDPSKGGFATFASSRIHFAMTDELRTHDVINRYQRKWRNAYSKASFELGSGASHKDVADVAGMSLKQVDQFSQLPGSSRHGAELEDSMLSTHVTALDLCQDAEELSLLRLAIEELPDRERMAVKMHYLEGITMAKVGDIFGVTESRICQILKEARKTIKVTMIEMGV